MLVVLHLSVAPWVFAQASQPSQSSQKALTPQQQVMLILGDSLSAAYGVEQEQGWVERLRAHWQTAKPDVRIVNASVSGATTAAGLNRLPDLLHRHDPRWLVIELGGNDGLQGKQVNYIKRNLKQMIELAQQRNVDVFLVGMRLPPNLGKRYVEPFFAQYEELARAESIGYLPFLLDGVAGVDGHMQEDGVHPTAKGQEVIFKNIAPLLEQWMVSSSADVVR